LASSQLPQDTAPADYEKIIGPYAASLKRDLETGGQWLSSVKILAKIALDELSKASK